ncbi:hypothetical protein [Paenibacillus piri]|uniref:Uncharacterized protein n=1 Tax=Paenibacillus piri TaxID=2547395 RepID=A0A4R5KWR9_9BACL|nr:hypothetical protein [Paenibacillus piri]TDF99628.1 hypothetical protein E1757_07285 [Paenibacillus piri]
MIQYGAEQATEFTFQQYRASIEPRDNQWVDVELRFELKPGCELPVELTDLTALLICTRTGDIFQIVPQDEGRDCEFQFTEAEKVQLRLYYDMQVKPRLLQLVKSEA